MRDTMVIALPVLAVLFGIFRDRDNFSRLESRMTSDKTRWKLVCARCAKRCSRSSASSIAPPPSRDARIDKLEKQS